MSDQPERPLEEQHHNPIELRMPKRRPVMTFIIIGVTVVVFIFQYLLQPTSGTDILFLLGGKFNALILEGEFWRLVTPVFLHSSILHLTFNMYALYVIGRRLERFYGHGRFLLVYLLAAFAGNVFSFVMTSANSLGASTAIFGLFSAEGMFILQNRKMFGTERTRKMIINLCIILAINLVYGFVSTSSVDNMGHIGGLLGGIFFAWKGGPILKITGEPPIFQVKDGRKIGDILLAVLVVILGFAMIAAIPFLPVQ